MKQLRILNAYFQIVTKDQTIDWISNWIKNGHKGYLCTVNVAILMTMRHNKELQEFVDDAAMVVADGTPIIWYSKLAQTPLPERVTGIDLIEDICNLSANQKLKIYFMGADFKTIISAARKLYNRFPEMEIVGVADGYFSAFEAANQAKIITESGANILIVGMGVPKQENFLKVHWNDLKINLAIPVGGSFEVIGGNKKRAPNFIQKIGLEWMFRLIQEPKRLLRRYLTTGMQFIVLVTKEILLGNPDIKNKPQ